MWGAERTNLERRDTRPFALQTIVEYQFARDRVTGLNVADIGCGSGYGTKLLAEEARSATGVDRSPQAISFAKERYGSTSPAYLCADAMGISNRGVRFEAAVACHFIEHVEDQAGLLQELRRILISPGLMFIATPNRLTSLMDNPYHYRELTYDELEHMMRAVFPHVEMYSVVMSERLQAYREIRRRTVRRLYALDPLRLRYRVPRRIHQMLFDIAALVGNRLIARSADRQGFQLALSDFTIVEGEDPDCLDLIAVARL